MELLGSYLGINSLESLINRIKSVINITEEQICARAGYNEGYISQTRSRGKVSKKFIKSLELEFYSELNGEQKPEEKPEHEHTFRSYDTKESVLRMLDKSLDANSRHAAANEKNADSLIKLVKMLSLQFNFDDNGEVSQSSEGENKQQPSLTGQMEGLLDTDENHLIEIKKNRKGKSAEKRTQRS